MRKKSVTLACTEALLRSFSFGRSPEALQRGFGFGRSASQSASYLDNARVIVHTRELQRGERKIGGNKKEGNTFIGLICNVGY
jgi:hypothetical protein